ncbi:RNA-binding domain-containing protein [Pseudomonas nitroreducens]|uniref:ATP-binding protein n=1 Tax=Pseudomonas nitroreducens TaxID=46680 RepID=A0A6G6IVN0_PSENT|nr:RNA-binding domain-containing protein [Pseudomonas nitroreducens]QIE87109.1 ATP-binding protein [Pseudomonas nitroreducens]
MEIIARIHTCTSTGDFDVDIIEKLTTDAASVQECEALDFKRQTPENDVEYLKLIKDIVALHNSYGGFIAFGIDEKIKDREFQLSEIESQPLQPNKIRDNLFNYTGQDIRFRASSISVAGKQLEIVWVAKRSKGASPVKFSRNGPDIKPKTPLFKKGQVVFRRIDNNSIAETPEDYEFLYSPRTPPSLEIQSDSVKTDDPLENNLPDRALICSNFVGRESDLGELWAWLVDDFSRVKLIAGEGGLGKTSIAYRFAEEITTRLVKPFIKTLWLTAKKRQFIASKNTYREAIHVDFHDAESLYKAVAIGLGCIESDFENLSTREIMQLALETCSQIPSFIVIDDVDSLPPEDQLRALEFGMRLPSGPKLILTTRVNFSFSPDNVIHLNGFSLKDFTDYIQVLRDRHKLPSIKEGKIEQIHSITGGSPLFADSLIRLESRGVTLDQAIKQWKGEQGIEVRKAALQREIQQLGKPAKRVLYVISILKNCSYPELQQTIDYSEQTLGDAIAELRGLFLINAPSIAKETRFTIDANTARLVQEISSSMAIDHVALKAAATKPNKDAIGLGLQKRSSIVGLAINQANALLRSEGCRSALATIAAAQKKSKIPHPDLLLASGRFKLKLSPPAYDDARKDLEQAYNLGSRKPLLYDLWFEAEYGRGSLEDSIEVATYAINDNITNDPRWYERRAQVRFSLANRAKMTSSIPTARRELESAIKDLKEAKKRTNGELQLGRINSILKQAESFRFDQ